jgi:hypothetical protein
LPTTIGIRAGELFIPKNSHRLVFGERRVVAFFLEIDVMVAVGAFENDSIS